MFTSRLSSALLAVGLASTPALAAPDLTLELVELAATVADPGEQVVASCDVLNLGADPAPVSQVRYYLSADELLDGDDTYLNYDAVSPLDVAESGSEWANVRVPVGTPDGAYFVLFVADARSEIVEEDEGNNVVARPLTVGQPAPIALPDLILADWSVDRTVVAPGERLSVTATVQNDGALAAPGSRLIYYISDDAMLDAADRQLSYDTVPGLGVGALGQEDVRLRVSTATAPGLYHLLLIVDADGVVDESDEANNVVAVAITVDADQVGADLPDLVATSVALSTDVVTGGDRIGASAIVRNDGTSGAGTSRLKYYLSANATYEPADTYLNYDNVGELAPGAASGEAATLAIPVGLADGPWFVLFVADHLNTVTEQRESNNVAALPFTVGAAPVPPAAADLADLMSVDVAIELPAVEAGERTVLTHNVFNAGSVASGTSRCRYYFSVDPVWDGGDTYLGYDNVVALAPGEMAAESANLRVPADALHGAAFFLVVVDTSSEVEESFEDNNVYPQQVSVVADDLTADLADVVPSDPVLDRSAAAPGQDVGITALLTNAGTQPANASRTQLYWSADQTWSPSDAFLGHRPAPSLVIGGESVLEAEVRVPWDAADGEWFIVVVADGGDHVQERVESNNVVAVSLMVDATTPPVELYPYDCDGIATDASLLDLDTVATFNTLHLGWDNGKDMQGMACVVSHFSLAGLVEIDTPESVAELEVELEALTGEAWSHFVSEHAVGSNSRFEYYAYIWRDATVVMTASLGFFPDPDGAIKRDPYGADFRIGEFDFTLVLFHLRYGSVLSDRRDEAAYLDDIYGWFQAANGDEQDVLIGGDFNLPGDDPAISLVGQDGVTFITDPQQPTSISAAGLTSSFDNILYSSIWTAEFLFSGVLDFAAPDYATLRQTVSDHIPVWMAIDPTLDDD